MVSPARDLRWGHLNLFARFTPVRSTLRPNDVEVKSRLESHASLWPSIASRYDCNRHGASSAVGEQSRQRQSTGDLSGDARRAEHG